MKILEKVSRFIAPKSQKTFADQPSWVIVPVGAMTFIASSYFCLMFAEVVPRYITAVNQNGFNVTAVKIACLLAVYAIPTWYLGCIAARCHTLLYERWFK